MIYRLLPVYARRPMRRLVLFYLNFEQRYDKMILRHKMNISLSDSLLFTFGKNASSNIAFFQIGYIFVSQQKELCIFRA